MSPPRIRRVPTALARLTGAIALIASVAVGFTGGPAAAETAGAPGALGNVSLTVLAPTPGEVVTGPRLTLKVYANGYRLDARYAGTADSSTIGHYHEILDGRLVDMTPLRDPTNDTVSMVGVSPGPHTLTLVPANNDHSMVSSAAVNIPFTYSGTYLPLPAPATFSGPPTISVASPLDGSTVSGSSFSLAAHISNFELCGDCFGKADISGLGHWHIFADQVDMAHMKTMASGTSQQVPLAGITPGWHTFYAVLVGDDHMPFMTSTGLVPTTVSAVRLYVTSNA
jgi:hypothetical protein